MATLLSFIDARPKDSCQVCHNVSAPQACQFSPNNGPLFPSYDTRKLLTPATIARVKTQFHLPRNRTEIQSDWHYQSNETPNEILGESTLSRDGYVESEH
jgi:hypothetical protein